MDKKKLKTARNKIDQLDNEIFYLIKKRTALIKYMLTDAFIGGIGGAVSRTCVAPIELYRVQRQNSFIPNSTLKDVFIYDIDPDKKMISEQMLQLRNQYGKLVSRKIPKNA